MQEPIQLEQVPTSHLAPARSALPLEVVLTQTTPPLQVTTELYKPRPFSPLY